MNDEMITRRTEMEQRLGRIAAWLREEGDPPDAVREDVRLLSEYYEGALWRRDFEADEAGMLPPQLRRGVLSEDAVYDVLSEYGERVCGSRKVL